MEVRRGSIHDGVREVHAGAALVGGEVGQMDFVPYIYIDNIRFFAVNSR